MTNNTTSSPTSSPLEERIAALVERYRTFSRTTAESIIEQAKAVYEVEQEFGDRFKRAFYVGIGLTPNGSTKKEFITIGAQYTRLIARADVLPHSWTTIYGLAKMDVDAFNRLVELNVLSPQVTAKQIDEALNGKRTKAKSRKLVINFDSVSEPLEVTKQLKYLASRHGLALENIERLEDLLAEDATGSSPPEPVTDPATASVGVAA